MRRLRRSPRALVAAGTATAAAVTLLLVWGWPATGRENVGPTLAPRYADYVALGDSYTAAPYVPVTDLATDCLRSTDDYPHLVARRLHVRHLQDRSCTGATTADVTGPQLTHLGLVPPQITALSPRTDLVTVSLGFNDGHLYHRVATFCRLTRGFCRLYDERASLGRLVHQVRPELVSTLAAVRRRAPNARILLVGYPDLAPTTGSCRKLPDYRPRDLAVLRDVDLHLRGEMSAAARQSGVGFVDVYQASRVHDVCAAHPWVQGRLGDRRVAAALHPLIAGERAVARLVVQQLRG